MGRQQRGLGKGLGALLGDKDLSQIRKPVDYVNKSVVSTGNSQNSADIMLIPVEMIEPNPFQPRMSFDAEALEELADSIRTLGLIQPITVRRKNHDRYQIISGERRFRACRLAGMDEIPAYIIDTGDQGMLEMAIVENIQREDLDPIEIAMSYERLINECNLTQEQMASRVGKKRASVTNFLRLLKLPAKIQHDLKVGLLSVGHAKVLLGVENDGRVSGKRIDDDHLTALGGWKTEGNLLPPPAMALDVFHLDAGDVVVITVFPSAYPPIRYQGQVWVRIGARKALANEEDIHLLEERRQRTGIRFEEQPCRTATLEDLDVDIFRNLYLPRAIQAEVIEDDVRPVQEQLAALRKRK